MKTFIALLAFSALCCAQEAKIIILEPADSKELAASYREYKAAQTKWEALKKEKAAQYTSEAKLDAKGKPLGSETQTMPGWEDVQYSVGFRALVPANSQYARRSYCQYGSLYFPNYWSETSSGALVGATGATGVIGSSATNLTTFDSGASLSVSGTGTIVATPLSSTDFNPDLYVKNK